MLDKLILNKNLNPLIQVVITSRIEVNWKGTFKTKDL
jgi:hypothetical protein